MITYDIFQNNINKFSLNVYVINVNEMECWYYFDIITTMCLFELLRF